MRSNFITPIHSRALYRRRCERGKLNQREKSVAAWCLEGILFRWAIFESFTEERAVQICFVLKEAICLSAKQWLTENGQSIFVDAIHKDGKQLRVVDVVAIEDRLPCLIVEVHRCLEAFAPRVRINRATTSADANFKFAIWH